MQLKLAEYKDGKFERFLELGKDFIYGGNYIVLVKEIPAFLGFADLLGCDPYIFKKDEKDPLNRFGGIFNNRSYGEGRFILVESKIIDRLGKKITMSQDEIFSYNEYIQRACDFINFHHWQETEDQVERNPNFKILGNLHEQPELWGKVK